MKVEQRMTWLVYSTVVDIPDKQLAETKNTWRGGLVQPENLLLTKYCYNKDVV